MLSLAIPDSSRTRSRVPTCCHNFLTTTIYQLQVPLVWLKDPCTRHPSVTPSLPKLPKSPLIRIKQVSGRISFVRAFLYIRSGRDCAHETIVFSHVETVSLFPSCNSMQLMSVNEGGSMLSFWKPVTWPRVDMHWWHSAEAKLQARNVVLFVVQSSAQTQLLLADKWMQPSSFCRWGGKIRHFAVTLWLISWGYQK